MGVKNNIKRFRKTVGLTQEQLAILIKIGRSTISEIETEKHIPGVDIALALAKALNCRVEDIFVLKGEKR